MTRSRYQEIKSESVDVIEVKDENDNVLSEDFYNIPLDEFEQESGFLYINDNDNNSNLGNEGSIIFRAPSKLSWAAAIGGFTIIINLIITGAGHYYNQNSFNERVLEKIAAIEAKQADIALNMYTRTEEDLRYENLKLEIRRHDEAINALNERLR